MRPVFSSIVADYIPEYLSLLDKAGRYSDKAKCYLKSLDRFLSEQDVSDAVPEELISKWLASKPVKNATKSNMHSEAKGFAKYLASVGFSISMPEAPRVPSDYAPYIFSDEEFSRIIFAADNFLGSRRVTKASLLFPFLLRILYGCGLRLGEGIALAWKDVDFEGGAITVRAAKNLKQRLVPMSASMAGVLKSYREMTRRDGMCREYLFETEFRYGEGKPYRNCAFDVWFAKVLGSAGISHAKSSPHERGPCPHCLRHMFAFNSFLKSETEGRAFDETAPALSAYLGHENLFALEKYLRADYSMYKHSHRRVGEYINDIFPEVSFQ
jgi:integrase